MQHKAMQFSHTRFKNRYTIPKISTQPNLADEGEGEWMSVIYLDYKRKGFGMVA